MTTDPTSRVPSDDAGRQARLEALQRRRTATQATEAPPSGKCRRRHAATGARILAGSLSASAALGLMAVMAGAPASDTGATPNAPAAARPVVIVVRSSSDSSRSDLGSPTIAAAPAVSASTRTPVTTSQAS